MEKQTTSEMTPYFTMTKCNEKHQSANPQHLVLRVFTKQCSLLHLHTCIVSRGVYCGQDDSKYPVRNKEEIQIKSFSCVQYLHYILDEYQIMDGDKTP